jgi:hypothetical protein
MNQVTKIRATINTIRIKGKIDTCLSIQDKKITVVSPTFIWFSARKITKPTVKTSAFKRSIDTPWSWKDTEATLTNNTSKPPTNTKTTNREDSPDKE